MVSLPRLQLVRRSLDNKISIWAGYQELNLSAIESSKVLIEANSHF